jgi:atypical dual specificity phosphatase
MFRFADNDWIIPGRLLASVMPESYGYIAELKGMGITSVLNLTEETWPKIWIKESGMNYIHIPVVDFGIPTVEQARKAIGFIEENISKGAVMVHCRAGLGRTGTIIGIYLVETGMDPMEAIDTVRGHRPGSLEVEGQEEFVRSWMRRG